uniref:Uncharacterized protein n=1 Tax=Anopheles dirus TaxID=7168 RepID=A0A182NY23_9DIPT
MSSSTINKDEEAVGFLNSKSRRGSTKQKLFVYLPYGVGLLPAHYVFRVKISIRKPLDRTGRKGNAIVLHCFTNRFYRQFMDLHSWWSSERIQDAVRDVFRLEAGLFGERFAGGHLRSDQAWADARDFYFRSCQPQLVAHRFRERRHSVLGCRIYVNHPRWGNHMTQDAVDVDDVPIHRAFLHGLVRFPAAQRKRNDVSIDHITNDLCIVRIQHTDASLRQARVVHQHVNTTELLLHLPESGQNVLFLRDVTANAMQAFLRVAR